LKGVEMISPDQTLIDGLTKRLKVDPSVTMDFSYGQLRRAASFAVKECGHEWALKVSVVHEKIEHRRLRGKIRNILEQALTAQGKSTAGVWRQFRVHAIHFASKIESKKIISRISSIN
jgi:hypothetical protein